MPPLELATRVEDVVYATIQALHDQWAASSPDRVRQVATSLRCLARPFEDAEARVLIYTPKHVIYQAVWPAVGHLTTWRTFVTDVWDTLWPYFHHATTCSERHPS